MSTTGDVPGHGEDAVSITVALWDGTIPSRRCQAHAEYGCDLLAGHDGPHFFVNDHDLDGDVSIITTWREAGHGS